MANKEDTVNIDLHLCEKKNIDASLKSKQELNRLNSYL